MYVTFEPFRKITILSNESNCIVLYLFCTWPCGPSEDKHLWSPEGHNLEKCFTQPVMRLIRFPASVFVFVPVFSYIRQAQHKIY